MTQPGSLQTTRIEVPADVRWAADYARHAPDFMAPDLFAHIDGGSGDDRTAAANLSAFTAHAIVPRVLRPVHHGHMRCDLGDGLRQHPIMLAPVGWLGLIHPQAERATAAAAAAAKAGLVVSTMASLALEDIAADAGEDRWFQLYVQPDRAVTLDLVRRAERAGYRAIVVTVDTPVQLPSKRAVAAGFHPPAASSANLARYAPAPPIAVEPGQGVVLNGMMRAAAVWDDIERLVGETRLPVWVKGVMHADDAREAAARGAKGIIVSNHGGRALDGAPSSLSRVAGIRASLNGTLPLLFDGGIRSGTDIFKAIALGANAVLVGRLQVYALAVAGALGVAHMIRLLREELEACMALAGCATLADIRAAELVSALPPERAVP